MRSKVAEYFKSGFRATGLRPTNHEEVLKRIPGGIHAGEVGWVLNSLIDVIKEHRGTEAKRKCKRRKSRACNWCVSQRWRSWKFWETFAISNNNRWRTSSLNQVFSNSPPGRALEEERATLLTAAFVGLVEKTTRVESIGFSARNVMHGFVDPVIKIVKQHPFLCATNVMIRKNVNHL